MGAGIIAGGTTQLLRRAEAQPVSGTQATASRRTLRSQIQATGVVRAMVGAEVKVGARISGKVEKLFANIGDHVEKGATIARLEDSDLRARVAKAEADRDAARAQLALIRRGARREEIAEGEANMSQAEAERALAVADVGRKTSLLDQGVVSREDADRSARDHAVATAKVASARSRLELLKQRYLPEDVALAQARLKQAEATVAEAQANLSYATITAPISGSIAQVTTEEGETVAAGMNAPTFVTLIDLDRLEVAAYVDEVDVGRVKLGQAAIFTVDSFPDVEFTGKVTAVYPRAVIQSNVVNYITTIAIENSQGRLKPDMTATVTITLEERPGVLAIPDQALRREGGKRVVYRSDGGKPYAREVKVGVRGGGYTEVTAGLREGETVLVGEPSQPTEAKESP
jgi:multidrug efflux pump subunit AcrA (membrane-fusion protein)